MKIKQGDMIEIKGQKYVVQSCQTPNDMQALFPNMAKVMIECGIIYDLYLRKPKGQKVFSVCLFKGEVFGPIVQLW